MDLKNKAFKINLKDNVATAVLNVEKGKVAVYGEIKEKVIIAREEVKEGHKIALKKIKKGEKIVKYGVPIGVATRDIQKGEWVHLHCIRSAYDERSSHLDPVTGAPSDIVYE